MPTGNLFQVARVAPCSQICSIGRFRMTRAMDISSQPSLRLVFPEQGPTLDQARASRAIEIENHRAARLAQENDHDVRRILAIKAGQALEGGRAAILGPQHRRDLVRHGAKLGLRPFEANLIIAVVQDHARRGETPADAQPTLSIINRPAPAADTQAALRWYAAIASALAGTMFLIWWLLGENV